MDPSGTTWSPEGVLGERAWIRRLGRELVGDASAADDLAQDAWLAAADRPPREPGPLGPWLRGVARRLALQRRREESRRARRERARARPEAQPSTDELVLRAELQRRVAEAVVALPEPYRTVVLLRYFDDLSAAEIARRSGLPAATVRSQLARGLARLREALDDAQPGGRAAWMGLFVSWMGESSVPAASGMALVGGALAMKGILALCAAALALVGIWYGLRSVDSAAPTVDAVERVEVGAAPEERGDETPRAEPARAERSVAELDRASDGSAAGALAPDAAEPEATSAGPAVVEARLVDEAGRGLVGGTLALEHPEVRARADATGRVRLEVELRSSPWPTQLVASAPGRASDLIAARLESGSTVPLGELVLRAAGAVSGRVLDREGAPLAGVEIVATGPVPAIDDPEELRRQGPRGARWGGLSALPEARSTSDGAFRIEGVPAGAALVWAGGEGHAWSSSGPLEVRAGEELRGVELALDPLAASDRIEGVVLSPAGEPVPSARLLVRFASATYSKSSSLIVGPDGRFDLLLDQRVPHDFEANDPEDRWSAVLAEGVAPGTRGLELRFEEARFIAVAPRSGGAAVEDFSATARRQTYPNLWETIGGAAEPEDEPGIARLRTPTVEFQVVVDAPGFALATLGPFDPAEPPAELAVELEPLPGVRGRVIADGEPVAGARVLLQKLWPRNVLYMLNGFRSLVDPSATIETTSDAAGRFHLDLREEAEYALRAEQGGRAPAVLGPLALDPAEGATGIELAFVAGGAIEGRLAPAAGEDPAGRVVAVHRGDGRPRTQRVASDGRYRFEALSPGMWHVSAPAGEPGVSGSTSTISTRSEPLEMEWSCEVFPGETTWFDLSEEREECVLDGRLALGAAPLVGWTAELLERSGDGGPAREPRRATLDGEGRFRLVATRSGTHFLELRAPGSERGGLVLDLTIELRAGGNERAIELEAGALTGDGAPVGQAVETLLEYRWRSPDDPRLACRARIVPAEDGRFALPLVPAGEATIHAYAPKAEGDARWSEVARFEVPAGGARHVVLR